MRFRNQLIAGWYLSSFSRGFVPHLSLMAAITPRVRLLVQNMLGTRNCHLSRIVRLNQRFPTKTTSISLPLYLSLLQRLLAFSTSRVMSLGLNVHLVIHPLLGTI
jgi:hypothetical protein